MEDLRLEGLAWDGQTAQFDLTLDIQEDENGIWASFDYAADLFDASTVERLAGHWRNLLRGIVANPRQRLGELPLLDAPERRQTLRMEPGPARVRGAGHLCSSVSRSRRGNGRRRLR